MACVVNTTGRCKLAKEITSEVFGCVSLIPNEGKIDWRIYYTKQTLLVGT